MAQSHSITELIERLHASESAAERAIWNRCIETLVTRARARLGQLPRRAADEEDIAIQAFNAFLRGVKDRRFHRLENREDLWQILAMLTERKVIAMIRHERAQKRGGGHVLGETAFGHQPAGETGSPGLHGCEDPSPATLDMFTVEVREMLDTLDDELLRAIAIGKLEGYRNRELAHRLGIAQRSVERKLNLIRLKWEQISSTE